MRILGERLVEKRKKLKVNQEEIANKIGISRTTYTNYEKGKHDPSLDILIKIADYYDTTTDYLLGRLNPK